MTHLSKNIPFNSHNQVRLRIHVLTIMEQNEIESTALDRALKRRFTLLEKTRIHRYLHYFLSSNDTFTKCKILKFNSKSVLPGNQFDVLMLFKISWIITLGCPIWNSVLWLHAQPIVVCECVCGLDVLTVILKLFHHLLFQNCRKMFSVGWAPNQREEVYCQRVGRYWASNKYRKKGKQKGLWFYFSENVS